MAVELTIDPAFVRVLIAKAEAALTDVPDAYHDEIEAETEIDAATSAREKPVDRLEEEVERDETATEVAMLIEDLNVDEKAELVALAWVGRGDYEAERFEEAVADARERAEGPTSDYLLQMPLVPSYLAIGLDAVTGEARTDAEV